MAQDIDHIENSMTVGPGPYDKTCDHKRTTVMDWCKGRNAECPAPGCGVVGTFGGTSTDCNELMEKEICLDCGRTL